MMKWSSKKAREYWNRRAQQQDRWSAVLDQSQPAYVNRGYHRWLSKCIALYLTKGGRALDVGCGLGRNFPILVERKMRVHGLDLAELMLRKAADQSAIWEESDRPILVQGLADHLPYRDGQFDLVLCTEVLFHLPGETLQRALAEMSRVLQPGGHCLITINNSQSISLRGKRISNVQDERGYLCNILSSSSIVDLAASAGLFAQRRCYRVATSLLDIGTTLPLVRPVFIRLRRRGVAPYVWAYQIAVLLDGAVGQFQWLGERVSSLVFIGFEKRQ